MCLSVVSTKLSVLHGNMICKNGPNGEISYQVSHCDNYSLFNKHGKHNGIMLVLKSRFKSDVVIHAYNLSMQEIEPGGL